MKNKIVSDNRGMTLVELLVGITILSLIVSPLLHSFITASKTAQKSTRLGQATTAGQNIVERLDATHMDTLVNKLNDGSLAALFGADSAQYYVYDASLEAYRPADPTDPKEACVPDLPEYRVGLKGLTYGNTTFDALITLDATQFPDSQTVHITQYTPMDAVFAQPYEVTEDPDKLAASLFADKATRLSGTEYTPASFRYNMNRIIKIVVDRSEDGAELTATATYEYRYNFTYSIRTVNPDGTETTTHHTEPLYANYSYEFYHKRITAPAEGEEADPGLTSIYFFFYPNYQTSTPATGYRDNLYIYNKDDLKFSIFLIKQKTPGMSDSEIIAHDTGYSALVRQYHSTALTSAPAQVFSNLNMQLVGDPPQKIFNPQYHMYRGDIFYRDGDFTGDLVFTKPENRFYGLTVSLFEPGETDLFSAKPIYTIRSSKLD